MKNLNQIKHELNGFYGTNQFYHGMFKKSVYTDGVQHLLKEAQCYWLYQVIETEILSYFLQRNPLYDTYTFKIESKETKAVLTLSDYQGEILWTKPISFTTFPDGELSLVVGWDGQRIITSLIQEN